MVVQLCDVSGGAFILDHDLTVNKLRNFTENGSGLASIFDHPYGGEVKNQVRNRTDNNFWNLSRVVEHWFLITDLVANLKKFVEEIKLSLVLRQFFFGDDTLEEISTQNGPFNHNSNSMSSCVSQWNCFKFEIPYRS